jgi:alkylated DNA repair dioxygenase AlkB
MKRKEADIDCKGNSKQIPPSRVYKEIPTNREATVKHIGATSERKDVPVPWWKQTKQRKTRIDDPISPTSEPLPGLLLFEGFITEKEEASILAELDGSCPEYRHEFLPWKQSSFNGPNKGKRWGVHCNLRDRRVTSPENPMPHFFDSIVLQKLKRVVSMAGCIPNEANAIDYHRKQGHSLQSHVDDRQLSKEPIANLSIAGDCYMTFCNERVPGEEKCVLLRGRTLQVLTGKARYDYSHGIRNEDLLSDRRVSVTMRESPLKT